MRVRLREVEPAVLRVLDVPATARLPELHDLLQAGLGWTDSHLHQFVTGDTAYGMAEVDPPEDERDESGVRLQQLPDRFSYLYDYGDGWDHDVQILGPGGDRPGCMYGEGACPPEDCGGPHRYAELRAILADPSDEEHAAMRAWAGDWTPEFDQADTDLLMRQTAGAVPTPVRLVLDLAAGGVRLTPGGRLPRAFVRQVQQHRPGWHLLGRPASIEDDLPPLAALHDLLRSVGLLRLRHQVLAPTRAAGDEQEVIRRLRSWFAPDHGFTAVLAGVSVAMLASSGPHRLDELIAGVYPLLEDSWATRDGHRLTEHHVRTVLAQTTSVLQGLDLVDAKVGSWHAGDSARWLLPRATALAHLWSNHHAADTTI